MSWAQIQTFLRDKAGVVYVNPDKDYIKPYELGVDGPNEIPTVAANSDAGPFTMTAEWDGGVEAFYIKCVVYNAANTALTDYNLDFRLSHPGKRKEFMPTWIPLIACAGDGGRPYVLPETIFVPPVQALTVRFRNRDAAARQVEFVLGGVKFYVNSAPKEKRDEIWSYVLRRERTYTYFMTTDAEAALTASQTGLNRFCTVPDDADLEVVKLSAESDGVFRAELGDAQNDRRITTARQHGSLLFGGHIAAAMGGGLGGSGGVYPMRLATSLLVRRSTKIRMRLDDLSAGANTVRPVFAGRKITYAS